MHVFSLSFLTLRSWGAWLVNWTRCFFFQTYEMTDLSGSTDNMYIYIYIIYHDNAGSFMDLQARPPAIVVYTIQYVCIYVYIYIYTVYMNIYIYIHTTINIYQHLQHIYIQCFHKSGFLVYSLFYCTSQNKTNTTTTVYVLVATSLMFLVRWRFEECFLGAVMSALFHLAMTTGPLFEGC